MTTLDDREQHSCYRFFIAGILLIKNQTCCLSKICNTQKSLFIYQNNIEDYECPSSTYMYSLPRIIPTVECACALCLITHGLRVLSNNSAFALSVLILIEQRFWTVFRADHSKVPQGNRKNIYRRTYSALKKFK